MTHYRFCVVACDSCEEEFGSEPTMALAVQAAKKAGWWCSRRADLCPECQGSRPSMEGCGAPVGDHVADHLIDLNRVEY